MKDYKQLLDRVLTFGWTIAFGFFFGQLLWFVTPFSWPTDVIAGYLGGIVAGILLGYFVLNKIKASITRIVTALVILVFVSAVSVVVNRVAADTSLMRLEIQELRDNASRPQQ